MYSLLCEGGAQEFREEGTEQDTLIKVFAISFRRLFPLKSQIRKELKYSFVDFTILGMGVFHTNFGTAPPEHAYCATFVSCKSPPAFTEFVFMVLVWKVVLYFETGS